MSFDLLATLGIIVLAAGYVIYRFRKPSSGGCGCSGCSSTTCSSKQSGGCSVQETLTPLDKNQDLTQK